MKTRAKGRRRRDDRQASRAGWPLRRGHHRRRRLSIDAPRDLLFKKARAYNHYRGNPRIVRAFVDLSGDTVRWLEEMGLFFDWVPPFYALRCGITYLGAIGGILVNERMEMLDQARRRIAGLYAAGVDTGGWESETYCVELSGSTFGFALSSGHIAVWSACGYAGTTGGAEPAGSAPGQAPGRAPRRAPHPAGRCA